MRPIDGDALMELAKNHVGRTVDCNDIARFPILDYAPVRHGQWVERQGWNMGKWRRWLECSKCGYQDYYFGIYEDIPFTSLGNYCPNCGAKMEFGGI